jgi:hypothetical protein
MVCSTAYAIGICIVAVIAGIAVYYTVNKAPPDSDWVRNGIDAGISSMHLVCTENQYGIPRAFICPSKDLTDLLIR